MDLTIKKLARSEIDRNSVEKTGSNDKNGENVLDLSVKLENTQCKVKGEEAGGVKVSETIKCLTSHSVNEKIVLKEGYKSSGNKNDVTNYTIDQSLRKETDFKKKSSSSTDQRSSKQSPKMNKNVNRTRTGGCVNEKISDLICGDGDDNQADHLDYLGKYSMPLDSERGLYITGATILAMKGIISYEEYTTNKFREDIPQDFLDKKFYLGDVLGAIRGMTRLRLASCKDRLPSVTMFDHMKQEESEMVASGCQFITDSEESFDEDEVESAAVENSKLSNKHVGKTLASRTLLKSSTAKNTNPTVDTSPPKLRSQRKLSTDSVKKKARDDSKYIDHGIENEKELPHELHFCGECGVSISSYQHLDRHLERCRGSKRRQTTQTLSKRTKTQQTTAADRLASVTGIDANQDSSIGKLYVCDSEDGEVICGWEASMKGIPPGPVCPRCAYDVPTLYDLPLHQRHHTGTEKLTCPICYFSTFSTPVYLIHVEEHAT